ncbi:MAG: cation diffusion facilitator family transporter [Actinomycetota bacterium]|nr:cation diffusion facilitator family transporter [Actinomycetota bacterium]
MQSPPQPDRHAGGHGHTDHDHAGGHGHGHTDHDHAGGLRARLAHRLRSHSHDPADSVDDALTTSRAGLRALGISLAGLFVTAVIQAVVFAFSGSIGLLADTIHNFADALTAVPLGVALVVGRRPPSKRYTYGYGRAEDLAGLSVILVMGVSAVVTTWQAVARLVRPERVVDLAWVAAAGVVGFAGNELAARYRIRVGERIGSAALVADGRHARTDGFTSLAVVLGARGVALGWRGADPVVGLLITIAILSVLRGAARDIYRRLMDAVDPDLTAQAASASAIVPGVLAVDSVRVRWIGHELRAEIDVAVDDSLSVVAAHEVAEAVRHRLLHDLRRFADATVHVNPADAVDAHRATAHHYPS